MKTKLLAIMLLAGGSMFAETRVAIGIGFRGHGAGFYQPPPSYASRIPPCPGSDYTWVDGYWSQKRGHNTWLAGYWNRQPTDCGHQFASRFENNFNDGHDRQALIRGSEQDRYRGFNQDRNFSDQDHNQNRGSNQDQARNFGPNQNQKRGNSNRSNDHGSGYENSIFPSSAASVNTAALSAFPCPASAVNAFTRAGFREIKSFCVGGKLR